MLNYAILHLLQYIGVWTLDRSIQGLSMQWYFKVNWWIEILLLFEVGHKFTYRKHIQWWRQALKLELEAEKTPHNSLVFYWITSFRFDPAEKRQVPAVPREYTI